jgi:cystathionine gamma-synthase
MTDPGFNTLCVHAAHSPEAATGAIAEPIYLSTTFERNPDCSYPRGFSYSREGTPNRTALESCVAALEHGVGAVAFASGLAANMAVLDLLGAGERLVAPLEIYYGSLKQFRELTRSRAAELALADCRDPAAIEAAVAGAARLVWVETPTNPLLNITDLARAVELGHKAGARVVCDNTFATPVCQRQFDFGGHSDVLGGIVVVRDDAALLERLRAWQRMAGAPLAPFDCWLLRRSIATLALRVRAQCRGAMEVAQFLATHPAVERVLYPGLPHHPGHALAAEQMRGGYGAMVSVCITGGRDAALRLAARTRLFTRATSLGGVESLIEHRASVEGPGTRAPENLLRLSIGIEEPADLIEDLRQALG